VKEPTCDWCLIELAEWIHEYTDFGGCPYPALCDYSPACDKQFKTTMRRKGFTREQKIA
jgi:hypothetical protein